MAVITPFRAARYRVGGYGCTPTTEKQMEKNGNKMEPYLGLRSRNLAAEDPPN